MELIERQKTTEKQFLRSSSKLKHSNTSKDNGTPDSPLAESATVEFKVISINIAFKIL